MCNLNELAKRVFEAIRKKTLEYWLYVFLVAALLVAYILIGFFATWIFENGAVVRDANFGFSQLKAWRFRNFALFITFSFPLIWIVLRGLRGYQRRLFDRSDKPILKVEQFSVLFSLIMSVIFFVFSTNVLNFDGSEFQRKFEKDVPTLGFHATHDEMWELYIHSRFWFYAHELFGWGVPLSYRVVSSLMGGIFIYALLKYTRQRFDKNWLAVTLLICSGGYMQLFFGDVENYTMTFVLLFFYLWSAEEYIQERISLIIPAVILAIALMFHLLSGFFLLALAYLYFLALRRRQFQHIALAAVLSIAIIGLTLLFFDSQGLPLRHLLTNSHASGRGGDYSKYLVNPDFEYYLQMINLLFLLVPSLIFALPLVLFKRIRADAINIHLLLSIVGALILTFGWKAQLGVYNDWNLYAVTALPISLLVWCSFEKIPDLELKQEIATVAGFAFFLHSLTWIISNHYLK